MEPSNLLTAAWAPSAMLVASTSVFFALEQRSPGRRLPESKGWLARALFLNVAQLAITVVTARLWIHLFGDSSLFRLADWGVPIAEGFVAWFVGTFFFYWWHRLRHVNGWWVVFHQIHHSPSRIELLTSFYKHPLEILADAFLSALIVYPLLGCSFAGAVWYSFFAATGEYFYHANLRTPAWLRYVIQTPELHSVHHAFDVHSFNYGDVPLWDRLFGTYKDVTTFIDRCGFPPGAEARLPAMLAFQNLYPSNRHV